MHLINKLQLMMWMACGVWGVKEIWRQGMEDKCKRMLKMHWLKHDQWRTSASNVDVVETFITYVVRIEVDLVKIILNIVEQNTIDFIPMLEQENANEVVDIDRGDILNFSYYN